MLTLTVWFLVIVLSATAILGMLHVAAWSTSALRAPHQVLTALVGAVVLIVLALIWQVRSVAELDGDVVRELAISRGPTLTQIMYVATTMGDAIPTMTIATALAVIIYCQIRRTWLVLLIPLAVLVELAIQIAISKVFSIVTAADVVPHLVEGGAGSLPSGSVARLFVCFLIAGHICASENRLAARRLATLGAVLVLVQTVTRLYLARHLVGDIAGGLVLGLVLERLGASIITWNDSRRERRSLAMGGHANEDEHDSSTVRL